MSNSTHHTSSNQLPLYPGYEYRSDLEIFGWPLVHITRGYEPLTGRPRVSKGVIAIGEIAIGVLAVGGFAFGGLAVGGMGIGVIALGGLAIGGVSVGGIALGALAAVGGVAYSLVYAVGAMAHAQYVISPIRVDREIFDLLRQFWSGIRHIR
ncbi:MAG: hypothetical protein WA997_20395 [Anaerolineales bacterium]